ncbi:MAG: SAM-dependent chlorinase/fluorinase [Bacteroidales bacterium]|nr:SAM-dependent chlorinase/fluorinase [Bacteroidales bacterium]
MITISLTTDWGATGCYVGQFKAKLAQRLPGAQIVDVSHSILPYHINDAVYALRGCYQFFQNKTIHVVSIASSIIDDLSKNREFVCFQYKDYSFIGPNNGFWSMLFGENPPKIYSLEPLRKKNSCGSFSELDMFVAAINKLAIGETPEIFGTEVGCYGKAKLPSPQIQEDQILGTFLYFDSYGNGVTNITKQTFEDVRRDRPFVITVGRLSNRTDCISNDYENLSGDNKIIALFNTSGYLELSIPFFSLKNYGSFEAFSTRIVIKFYDSMEAKEKNEFSLF